MKIYVLSYVDSRGDLEVPCGAFGSLESAQSYAGSQNPNWEPLQWSPTEGLLPSVEEAYTGYHKYGEEWLVTVLDLPASELERLP